MARSFKSAGRIAQLLFPQTKAENDGPHQADGSNLDAALELISTNGLDGMAGAIRLFVNEAMKLERGQLPTTKPTQE